LKFYKDMDRAKPPKFSLEARLAVKAGHAELHFDVPELVAQKLLEASVKRGSSETVSIEWNGNRFEGRLVAARMDAFDNTTGRRESKSPGACTVASLRDHP